MMQINPIQGLKYFKMCSFILYELSLWPSSTERQDPNQDYPTLVNGHFVMVLC